MRNGIFLIVFSLLFVGCENEAKKQQELLFKEVMSIHDEVMPKMSSLKKMAKNLDNQIEFMMSDSLSLDSAKVEALKLSSENLKKANDSMMDWMHNFNQVKEGTPNEEAMKYLSEQKDKISKVRDNMLTSEKEAKELVTE